VRTSEHLSEDKRISKRVLSANLTNVDIVVTTEGCHRSSCMITSQYDDSTTFAAKDCVEPCKNGTVCGTAVNYFIFYLYFNSFLIVVNFFLLKLKLNFYFNSL